MIQQPISVEIKMADGIFIKSMFVHAAGTVIPQHSHEYDHVSMLAVGSVRVWKDGVELGEFTAPTGITIAARCKHTFLTLTDGTLIYCIHNIERSGGVDVHDEHELELT